MKRHEINRRIDNEKKLRAEGRTNGEIAQIMGLPYQTVYRDIGKEPADLYEHRVVSNEDAPAIVAFPGSIGNDTKKAEEPITDFARLWQNAENIHRGLQTAPSLATPTEPVTDRQTRIIVDELERAVGAWSTVVSGNVLIRQPKIEDEKLFFDNTNKPWLVIVYSEVTV